MKNDKVFSPLSPAFGGSRRFGFSNVMPEITPYRAHYALSSSFHYTFLSRSFAGFSPIVPLLSLMHAEHGRGQG